MKKFSLGLIAALVCSFSFAQETVDKKVNFSIGVELAAPVGDFGKSHNFGFGGTAQVEYMAAPQLGVTLNAGYIAYSGKEQNTAIGTFKNPSVSQIPVLAGLRYYFIKDIYVSAQAGISSFNRNIGTAFTYAPGIGIKVSIIDMTLKYMGATKDNANLNNTSLRVAVTF